MTTKTRGDRSDFKSSRNSSFKPKSSSSGGRFGKPAGKQGSPRKSGGSSRFGGGKSGGTRSRSGRRIPTFDPSQFINKNPVEIKEEVYVPKNDFTTFGLDARIVKSLKYMGITVPSPIQDQIIPEILNGNDVVGLAETGTGKTAAFLVPIIEKTLKDTNRQTLILAPTRELAIQIEEEFRKLSKGFKLFSVVCVGGINIQPQIRGLKRKQNFIIGTPGRVLDLIKRGNIKPQNITTVVLDEADRMLDMGFINDMRAILQGTPKTRETLFFSATMDKASEGLVKDFLTKPVTVSVKKKDVTNSIVQDVVPFRESDKLDTLLDIVSQKEADRVIIFCAMKHSCEKLSKDLKGYNIRSESIHGNKSHGQRQRSLNKFKDGEARILVATDVAARGIHVNDVSHVINYDLPQTFEDYVHRIGRTGRSDKKGIALTFVQSRK
jgi:ATP-dependent RNA helicase RhlE